MKLFKLATIVATISLMFITWLLSRIILAGSHGIMLRIGGFEGYVLIGVMVCSLLSGIMLFMVVFERLPNSVRRFCLLSLKLSLPLLSAIVMGLDLMLLISVSGLSSISTIIALTGLVVLLVYVNYGLFIHCE